MASHSNFPASPVAQTLIDMNGTCVDGASDISSPVFRNGNCIRHSTNSPKRETLQQKNPSFACLKKKFPFCNDENANGGCMSSNSANDYSGNNYQDKSSNSQYARSEYANTDADANAENDTEENLYAPTCPEFIDTEPRCTPTPRKRRTVGLRGILKSGNSDEGNDRQSNNCDNTIVGEHIVNMTPVDFDECRNDESANEEDSGIQAQNDDECDGHGGGDVTHTFDSQGVGSIDAPQEGLDDQPGSNDQECEEDTGGDCFQDTSGRFNNNEHKWQPRGGGRGGRGGRGGNRGGKKGGKKGQGQGKKAQKQQQGENSNNNDAPDQAEASLEEGNLEIGDLNNSSDEKHFNNSKNYTSSKNNTYIAPVIFNNNKNGNNNDGYKK